VHYFVVYVHLRIGRPAALHQLREQLPAFPQGGVLVHDAEQRGMPHIQHP